MIVPEANMVVYCSVQCANQTHNQLHCIVVSIDSLSSKSPIVKLKTWRRFVSGSSRDGEIVLGSENTPAAKSDPVT